MEFLLYQKFSGRFDVKNLLDFKYSFHLGIYSLKHEAQFLSSGK